MSAPETIVPADASPFWRFSVRFYAVPGVAPACIELQDQAGVDVNVLFFLLWNATEGRALSQAEVADIDRKVNAWRNAAVVPLRNIRRALRRVPDPRQGGRAGGRAAATGGPLPVDPVRYRQPCPFRHRGGPHQRFGLSGRSTPVPIRPARYRIDGICKIRNRG
jgi:uncharacterized protein (TIGR02444 family)